MSWWRLICLFILPTLSILMLISILASLFARLCPKEHPFQFYYSGYDDSDERRREIRQFLLPGSSSSPRLWHQTVARRRRIANGASGRRAWSRADCWRKRCHRPIADRWPNKSTSTTTLKPIEWQAKCRQWKWEKKKKKKLIIPWCSDPYRRRWWVYVGIAWRCASRSRALRSSRNPVGHPAHYPRWPIHVDPIFKRQKRNPPLSLC